jgi:hypothetical protein
MRQALLAPILSLAVVLAGCDTALGPGDGRYEGRYRYTGTVDGTSRYNVTGTLRITQQYFDEALVSIEWRYREGSQTLLELRSDQPARARIEHDGYIRFDFEGEFLYDGRWIPFELQHDGYIHGRRITGDWYLWTGLGFRGTEEWGRFSAQR